MLSGMDKPTAEELQEARNVLEAEIEKLGLGDGSTTPERVNYLSDLYIRMERRFREADDA